MQHDDIMNTMMENNYEIFNLNDLILPVDSLVLFNLCIDHIDSDLWKNR